VDATAYRKMIEAMCKVLMLVVNEGKHEQLTAVDAVLKLHKTHYDMVVFIS